MTPFCTSPLWDWNYTWHSEYPRLTACFENTVLAYIPGTVLVSLGFIQWLVKGRRKPSPFGKPISWTLLSQSRLALSVLLILTYAFSLTYKLLVGQSSGSSVTSDLVHTVTFTITLLIQDKDRKNGIGSSMTLFCFWLVTVVCKLPECSRHIQEVLAPNNVLLDFSELEFVVWASAFPMVLLQLLLSSWTDARHDPRRPYLTASPVSLVLFRWFSPLIFRRSRDCIQLEDIYSLPPDMMTWRKHDEWNSIWNKELKSARYVPRDGLCDFSRPLPSMFKCLWQAHWKTVVIACVLANLRAVLRTFPALLLHLVTGYMGGDDPTWKGILYALGMVSANFGMGLFAVHVDRTMTVMGLNVKTALVAAIYRKTLRLSSESQSRYKIGELVNLISVDAHRIVDLSFNFGRVASGAPLILISVVLLWQYLGVACLAGVAVMLVIMSIVTVTAKVGTKYQVSQMKLKDKRLNSVAEMLNSLKVLKLFALENIFMEKCTSVRLEEVSLLKKYSYLTAVSSFILASSSSVVSMASFVTYVLISADHVLDSTAVFVSLTLFSQMQYPIFKIPDFISKAIQTSISFKRIRKFLLSSEIDERSVGRQLDEGDAISLKNATLSWSKTRAPVLRNINLRVKIGHLIAIVGPVGSGKSSLLSALLGNLRVCSGSVDCVESVAYAPQSPWIQNETIRKNVIFTSAYDAQRYEAVLKTCCLERDLQILPGGDLTFVGQNGINLSGGQKQRVSLARAAYQKKDLYLFDDPLSAVDAHVSASLFRDLIGPRGMLKETTRILVTHNLSVLNEVDYIVVMEEGSVVECGTFEDLKIEGSVLSGLLKNFSKNVQAMTDKEDTCTTACIEVKSEEEVMKTTFEDEEKVEEGSIGLHVYRTYLTHCGPLISVVILFYAVYRGVGAYLGIWLNEWCKDAQLPSTAKDPSLRTYRIEIYVILCAFQAVVDFFAVAMLWHVALSASTTLLQLMLDGVMRAPLSFFDATPTGRVLNRFGTDVDQLDSRLPSAAHYTLDFFFHFAASVVLICINLPAYIMIAIPVVVCQLVLRQKCVVPFCQMKRLEAVTRSPVNSHFSESVTGLSSVRSYGVQQIFLRHNDDKVDIMQNCTLNSLHCEYWIQISMDVANEVLLISLLVLLVLNRDRIEPGVAGLLVSQLLYAIPRLNALIFYSTELEVSLVSAERLDEYGRLTPEAPWTSNFSLDPHWPRSGAVSFKSYSTRYRDGLDLVLKDVSLDITPGEKIGIVGRTGAGKSTIMLSLFRVVEAAAGNILVDGVDIAKLGLHDLRSRITIIPQDPVLFQGTLRLNLDPTGQHDAQELWSALDRSHLGDVFRQDGGLDFQVAEGGLNLSVGQRQLVCLARAVLRKTKIVVLDEATASVDMKTDLLVQQTLRDVMSGCTVLTVAHRLHSVLGSDRVVVMDQGRVVEVGRPSELLADTTSLFYAMGREAGLVFPAMKV